MWKTRRINMRDFRELKVWQKAHQLALSVYKATRPFPKEEVYGLTGQMRRACTSIPANIAEGSGRGTDPEMVRFLRIAMGSAAELEYFVLLARDLAYLDGMIHEQLTNEVTQIKRMLTSFIQKLKANG
jgi:four helix bundle protein